MPNFAVGVVKFQKEIYPEKKALFQSLSYGQAPEAMFITCSDSRIETAMITQSDPGDLFICRNAGNIVPPHKEYSGGMTASIEFAAAVLKVPHIVLCGHSGCGAMKGIVDPDSIAHLPYVSKWLGFARDAVLQVDAEYPGLAESERLARITERNVVLQLKNLASHPSVAVRLREGNLRLHGWVYDIATGAVNALDETTGEFVPVTEKYAADVARRFGEGSCCDDG